MCDQNRCGAKFFIQFIGKVQNDKRGLWVKRSGWFIKQQNIRMSITLINKVMPAFDPLINCPWIG